jgi:xylan 1,4-beta-xylosidase
MTMAPADPPATAAAARSDWLDALARRAERDRPAPPVPLPPPDEVVALRGRGHATIAWSPVPGAAGYLVHRSPTEDGDFTPIDHGGGDLLAVPCGPYVDTSAPDDGPAWYAVSSLATIEDHGSALSEPVMARSGPANAAITIRVHAGHVSGRLSRPWRPMIGSEHLALLLQGAGPGGHDVGAELAEAFGIVHLELGVEAVRAHGIFDDSLEVYRERDGEPVHDFTLVDRVLERLLATGLLPIVELSFMPRDLALDPAASVFAYGAIVSPPRDIDRWANLVRDFVAHLADRFGREEVCRWAFEVWNEPNMRLFWSGTEGDYLRLYAATARAVKAVDPAFRVGGPATAAAGWIDDFLAACGADDLPLDFLSTHSYGVSPMDLRPNLLRARRPHLPLWWTEWGVSPAHGAPVNDSAWAATLVAHGMHSAAGRLEALAYWVASDHFTELGEAPSLFHGGFGLLTIGNLRKPGFWALAMLERLGEDEVAIESEGDGSGSLVEAWASRDPDGRVAIAMWNGTLDQSKAGGDPDLDRSITLAVDGLAAGTFELRHHRVDARHSNIVRTWESIGRPDWPDEAGWAALHAADGLEMLEPPRRVHANDGALELELELPMPSVSLLELVPIRDGP